MAYNPIENAALVLSRSREAEVGASGTSSVNSATKMVYDLYMIPREAGSGTEPQHVESRSGSGCAVAWVGRNRFAVLESTGTVSL